MHDDNKSNLSGKNREKRYHQVIYTIDTKYKVAVM